VTSSSKRLQTSSPSAALSICGWPGRCYLSRIFATAARSLRWRRGASLQMDRVSLGPILVAARSPLMSPHSLRAAALKNPRRYRGQISHLRERRARARSLIFYFQGGLIGKSSLPARLGRHHLRGNRVRGFLCQMEISLIPRTGRGRATAAVPPPPLKSTKVSHEEEEEEGGGERVHRRTELRHGGKFSLSLSRGRALSSPRRATTTIEKAKFAP